MEKTALISFCGVLLLCLVLDISILYALGLGLVIFAVYAARRGYSAREILSMCLDGVKSAGTVLITFLLIGVLTALWRAAGTIPVLVCYATSLIRPALFLPAAFLLCCLVSVLTGTSFGTAATMGVICAAMGETAGLPQVLVGGVVLSGVFFGDRCSPVSTSALLISELTGTSIHNNIRLMLKTAAVPFAVTCAGYAVAGLFFPAAASATELESAFAQEFRLHWAALIPAALILLLSAFRVPVKWAMLASIASAVPLCLLLQGETVGELLSCAVFGYASDSAAASMIDGGGLVSMLRVAAIVCISSAYAGIFRKTGLLDGVRGRLRAASERLTPFGVILLTSALTGVVACNQTLTIMLTQQLCEEVEPDGSALAIGLEDTAVVVSPLIPWSIAGAVPLSSIGAPAASIFFAAFLYLLPLWRLLTGALKRRRARRHG